MTEPVFAGLYARFYDTFYHDKDTAAEVDLIEESICRYLGTKGKKRLLEVGCGTGRLLAELRARGGYNLHGIDISPAMIAEAEKKNPGIDFKVRDVRNYHSFRKFQVVLMYFNVVGYLLSDVDVIIALSRIRDSLVNGGLLIMDWWDSEMVVQYPPVITKHQYQTEMGLVERIALPSTTSLNKIVNIEYIIGFGHCGSSQGLIETERHRVRHFSEDEIGFYMSEAGLYQIDSIIPPQGASAWTKMGIFRKEIPFRGFL